MALPPGNYGIATYTKDGRPMRRPYRLSPWPAPTFGDMTALAQKTYLGYKREPHAPEPAELVVIFNEAGDEIARWPQDHVMIVKAP